MATKKAVVQCLATLCSNFAGDVTAEKIATWVAALDGVSDDALASGTKAVLQTYTGQFLPPVAVLRQASVVEPAVDIAGLLLAIDKAGSYNPNTGWNPPRVEVVRATFGDAVADAYGAVGGASRLFAANDTTREIASREFGLALAEQPSGLRALGSSNPRTARLAPGDAGSSPAPIARL